ncbi:Ldh family oxidoreductase, partial [Salmonella enterica subsp. enterica]
MSAQSPTVAKASTAIGFTELVALLQQVFVRHGTSPQVAAILAHNCASAERDGAHSHGVFRIPGYVSTLNSGWVNGKAVPVVED